MKTLLAGIVLALAASAQAAIIWTPVKPTDCTGLGTPTPCCTGDSKAANPGCFVRNTAGSLSMIHTDIRSDGGTYVAGGDIIPAKTIGLTNVVYGDCSSGTQQMVLWPQPNGNIKVQVFLSAGTEHTGAITAGTSITCDFYGR